MIMEQDVLIPIGGMRDKFKIVFGMTNQACSVTKKINLASCLAKHSLKCVK